jgi:hypothetical protein
VSAFRDSLAKIARSGQVSSVTTIIKAVRCLNIANVDMTLISTRDHRRTILVTRTLDTLCGLARRALHMLLDRTRRTSASLDMTLHPLRTGLVLHRSRRALSLDMRGRPAGVLRLRVLRALLRCALGALHRRARLPLHLMPAATRLLGMLGLAVATLVLLLPMSALRTGSSRRCERHGGGACDQHHLAGHE